MHDRSWIVLNFMVTFMLILLLIFRSRSSRLKMGKPYSKILVCTLVLVMMDTIARVGEPTYLNSQFLVHFGNLGVFLLDPFDILFSIEYVDCWMDERNKTQRMIFRRIFQLFVCTNAILILIDYFFKMNWFFLINGTHYQRGRFFLARAASLGVFIMIVFLYLIIYRECIMKDFRNLVFVLPLATVLGTLIQITQNMNTTYSAIAMACMILYFRYQSTDANFDYLTGVLNRRGIDIKLKDRIKNSANKGFSAIMLDMDNFKEINDTLGHTEGDYAIQAMAQILMDVFGNDSSVGRFGGDEFCIISNLNDTNKIDDRIEVTRKRLASLKRKRNWNEAVDISCGYELYDATSKMSASDFMDRIDALMYREKEAHHTEN